MSRSGKSGNSSSPDAKVDGTGPNDNMGVGFADFQDDQIANTNELIYGYGGHDDIFGGDGNDTIYGDSGTLPDLAGKSGKSGKSEPAENIPDNDEMYSVDGNDIIFGDQGNGTLYSGDNEGSLSGDSKDALITGGDKADQQFDGFGSDSFIGGEDAGDNEVDVFDLTDSNVDFISYVGGDPEAGTVTFLDGSTMTFSEFENIIPCFTQGTLIASNKGPRLVEDLQAGDKILTRDNGFQEIAWVGHKEMSGRDLVRRPSLRPVFVKAGSLGNGLPEHNMMLSPNHKLLIANAEAQLYFAEGEVFVAAKHLIGQPGISQVDVKQTIYIHFMFEKHEVVLSNGAWTESFHPGDYSIDGLDKEARAEILELFPKLATDAGLQNYHLARTALKKHEARLLLG